MLKYIENPIVLLINNDTVVVFLYYLMQRTFYNPKAWVKEKRWALPIIYLLTIALHVGLNLFGRPFLNMTAAIGCYILPLFVCYEVKNIRGITYFFFYLVGMIGIEVLVSNLMGSIMRGGGTHLDYSTGTFGGFMLMDLLEFVFCQVICYFGNKDKDKRLDKVAVFFMMMPIVSVLLVLLELYRIMVFAGKDYNLEQFSVMLFIMVLVNVVFFFVLEMYTKLVKKDAALMQTEMKIRSDAELMEMAAKSMRDRLATAEAVMSKDREMRHDRRHFEALLFSLLQEGKMEEAKKYLSERLAMEPKAAVRYCDNVPVNAALVHYVSMAERLNIPVKISANIPVDLNVDDMQLAITISNLIENAIHACEKLPENERRIDITAKYKEQLLLEISNSCEKKVELDDEGHPFSNEEGHGTGTRSVLAFVNSTESEIRYKAEEKKFSVRLII